MVSPTRWQIRSISPILSSSTVIWGLGWAGPTWSAGMAWRTRLYAGVDGITRFGAQDGDQSTGGVIGFGPNDVNGGVVGTNRALGLLSTGTTGSTAFALKLSSIPNTLNYINLSFLGEFWRNNKAARTMSFGYAWTIRRTPSF